MTAAHPNLSVKWLYRYSLPLQHLFMADLI